MISDKIELLFTEYRPLNKLIREGDRRRKEMKGPVPAAEMESTNVGKMEWGIIL